MYARMARPVNVSKFMSYFGDQPFSDKGIRAGNICMRYIVVVVYVVVYVLIFHFDSHINIS
jgi:hypothetical protein